MSKFDYILFDLDGTLTDPALGITNSVMYALEKFGISVPDRKDLYKFIGPPIWGSFEKFYQFSKDEASQAVEYYRAYYKDKGLYENHVYPDIENLLDTLKSLGITLIVATSKPEVFAIEVLEHFALAKYFSYIAGATLDGTRVLKEDVISYALSTCNIVDKSRVIMIGDREHDIIGAKKNHIQSIGVLYGYGSRDELELAGADYIARDVCLLQKFLMQE